MNSFAASADGRRIHLLEFAIASWKTIKELQMNQPWECELISLNNSYLAFSLLSFSNVIASSESQGRSVGPGEKALRKFSSTGGKAPGYQLSQDHFLEKFLKFVCLKL